MPQEADVQRSMQRIERLVEEVQASADPEARALAGELVESLLELHGAALGRIFEIVSSGEQQGAVILERFIRDPQIANLLLLYNLHPVDFETRVRQALDKVRPYLKSHGGDVELLGIDDGTIHLRLNGSCDGCPSSAQTLKSAIEKSVYELAPDAAGLRVEGVVRRVAAARRRVSFPRLNSNPPERPCLIRRAKTDPFATLRQFMRRRPKTEICELCSLAIPPSIRTWSRSPPGGCFAHATLAPCCSTIKRAPAIAACRARAGCSATFG